MALQGTIDTFPLTDVLGLLANSQKSGRLVLDGNRGSATLWIEEGRVHGGGPAPSATAAELVFGLLRFSEGSFSFDTPAAGDEPQVSVEPTELAVCVRDAEVLREEWRAIEAVVPSVSHRVQLLPSLRDETVTLDADAWELVVAAGSAPSVEALTASLGRSEFDTARCVAELLAAGLLEVLEPSRAVERVEVVAVTEPDPHGSANGSYPAAVVETVAASASPFPDRFPIDDLVGSDAHTENGSWDGEADSQQDLEVSTAGAFAESNASWDRLIDDALDSEEPEPGTVEETDSTDEVLRQMSRLSPQAAEAIAAALNTGHGPTGSGDEPEAPASFLGSF